MHDEKVEVDYYDFDIEILQNTSDENRWFDFPFIIVRKAVEELEFEIYMLDRYIKRLHTMP